MLNPLAQNFTFNYICFMSKTRAWISAMRLRTLPLSLSGIILGSSVAHFNGYWNITIFTLALVTTIFFQVLSNFANDLGDGLKGTDNEDRIGPKRAVQSGEISPKNMKIAVIFTSILSFISAGLLIYFSVQNMNLATVWFSQLRVSSPQFPIRLGGMHTDIMV